MRAQELRDKLRAGQLEKLHKESFHASGTITNLQTLRSRLTDLEGIPGFEEDEQYFRSVPALNSPRNQLAIRQDEWNELNERVARYATRLQGLDLFVSAKVGEQKADDIFVKLPPVRTLREAAEFQLQLVKVLEQLAYFEGLNGKVEIRSWEPGSLWLEIDLGNAQVVSLVGSACWAAAVIYKKIQEGKTFSEYARGLSIKNDQLEVFAKAQDDLVGALLDGECKALADTYLNGGTPEQLERLRVSVKTLAEMIHRGAEIHPAITAGMGQKAKFPDFARLPLLESQIKLIKNEGKAE